MEIITPNIAERFVIAIILLKSHTTKGSEMFESRSIQDSLKPPVTVRSRFLDRSYVWFYVVQASFLPFFWLPDNANPVDANPA